MIATHTFFLRVIRVQSHCITYLYLHIVVLAVTATGCLNGRQKGKLWLTTSVSVALPASSSCHLTTVSGRKTSNTLTLKMRHAFTNIDFVLCYEDPFLQYFECPYLLCVDHATQAVVVCVRGTLSFKASHNPLYSAMTMLKPCNCNTAL